MKKIKLVKVEWDDAFSSAPWKDEEDYKDLLNDNSFECINVGWLIAEDKKGILVAARKSNCGQYGLIERLPKRMIKKITNLKE